MKVLIFAHTPPPHHGQSFMVEALIKGLQSSSKEITYYHVNCRLSQDIDDIGSINFKKIVLLFKYCLQAIWFRFKHGVNNFYYVPAPGEKRGALYRDWIVMLMCRLFFTKIIFHWHGYGLGHFVEKKIHPWERFLSHLFLDKSHLSISLNDFNQSDIQIFHPQRIKIILNGINDPCPDFETSIMPIRKKSYKSKQRGSTSSDKNNCSIVEKALFIAHCTQEKGLFDAIESIRLANNELQKQGNSRSIDLYIAGKFMNPEEKKIFDDLLLQDELKKHVHYLGFITGKEKDRLFRESTYLIFPSYYHAEGQPLSLIEAFAYGLPSITTDWRGLPKLFPQEYPGIVAPQLPQQIAEILLNPTILSYALELRKHFLKKFLLKHHLDVMKETLLDLETYTEA